MVGAAVEYGIPARIHKIKLVQVFGEFKIVSGGITAESGLFACAHNRNGSWF